MKKTRINLRAVPVVAKGKTTAVLPSEEQLMDGTYQPLARPLYSSM
jgi:phosphate transport system substrate-binding protein